MLCLKLLSQIPVIRQVNTRPIFLSRLLGKDVWNSETLPFSLDRNEINDNDAGNDTDAVVEAKQKEDVDERDRSEKIDVETSIRYVKSKAFKKAYGDQLIWMLYRRSKTRHFPPHETRKTCIRQNRISTANPCPICRDKYLVLDHRNVDLLKQFICPKSDRVFPPQQTGLCRLQHRNLVIAVMKAHDYGTISFSVPYRKYDYNYYYELSIKNEDKA